MAYSHAEPTCEGVHVTGVLCDSCYLYKRNIQNPATLQYYKLARLVLLAVHSWVCPLALPVAVRGGPGEGKVSTPLKERYSSMGPTGAASFVADTQGLGGD